MWLLVGTIAIISISAYFVGKVDDDQEPNEVFVWLSIFGLCAIPSEIAIIAINHFGGSEEHKVLAMFLSIFTFAGFVIWATHGKTKNSGGADTDDKKDDFTAEAIIMTAVLSDDENSDSSSNSNPSSSSGSSSSSSNSDDFFFL